MTTVAAMLVIAKGVAQNHIRIMPMHRVVAVAIPEVILSDRLSREIGTTPTAYRQAFRGDPRRNVREAASA